MYTYRLIKPDEASRIRRDIWRYEMTLPEWYRAASLAWTPDYRSFIGFWNACREVWGLFDARRGNLVACVYLEFESELSVNIHVGVFDRYSKVSEESLVRFWTSLVRHKRSQGVLRMTAWILGRNRSLLRISERAGFIPNGLRLDFGASRGRLLRWLQVYHPNPQI